MKTLIVEIDLICAILLNQEISTIFFITICFNHVSSLSHEINVKR